MPIDNGYITAPIGLADVAAFFGTATDIGPVCITSIINKWAKYKPIALSTLGLSDTPEGLTEAQRKAANWGMVTTTAKSTSKADLPDKILAVCGSAGLWTYKRPSVNTDWTRLDDFANPNGWKTLVGYDHTATAPCRETDLGSDYETNKAADVTVWFSDRGKTAYPGQLHFDELKDFGTAAQVSAHQNCLRNCYLCLAFKSGTEWYYIFSEDTVDNMVTTAFSSGWDDEDPSVNVPVIITDNVFAPFKAISSGGSQQFTGYLFLIDLDEAFSGSVPTSYKGGCISQSALASHAYRLYALPVGNPEHTMAKFNVSVPAGAYHLGYNYTIAVDTNTTVITVEVVNDTARPAVLSRLFVYLASENTFDSGDYNSVLAKAEEWENSGTVYSGGISLSDGEQGPGVYAAYAAASVNSETIPSGGKKTFTFTFNGTTDAFGYSYNEYAWVMIGAQDSIDGRVLK